MTAPRGGRRHRPRVIPVLLLKAGLLYKGVRFRDLKYVGDPLVAVKIFNDKGTDELVVLDIEATPAGNRPNLSLIQDIAGECFMPLAYGGGVRRLDDIGAILSAGAEKVVIGAHALDDPRFLTEAAEAHGSQSIVACIDAKRDLLGRYHVTSHSGQRKVNDRPERVAQRFVEAGAGEIILNAVDRDGTCAGYDLQLVRSVAEAVDVPVIALGGAGDLAHLRAVVVEGRASAAAAGSLFVFQPPHRAVLITFPDERQLDALFRPDSAGAIGGPTRSG